MKALDKPLVPGTALLIWLTVVWTVLDLLLAGRTEQEWAAVVLFAIVAAQIATLAGWLALGDDKLLVRGGCVAVAIVIGEMIMQMSTDPQGGLSIGFVAAMLTGSIAAISLPLFVARAFGWRCRREGDGHVEGRPFQFRIAQVLILTAFVGVLLGLWRLLPYEPLWNLGGAAYQGLVLLPLVAGQWVAQLRPQPTVAIVVLVLIAATYCVLVVTFMPRDGAGLIATLAIYIGALGANLAMFRAWGYRLLGRSEQDCERSAESPAA